MTLIDNARKWYRLHSVQLALLAGPAIGWIVANPYEVKRQVASIGMALNLSDKAVAVIIGLLTTVLPILVRLRAQGVPPCPPALVDTDADAIPHGSDGTDGA